jgi:hypothetical protein
VPQKPAAKISSATAADVLYDNLWIASSRAATWARVGRAWSVLVLGCTLATTATATGSGVAALLKNFAVWGYATAICAVVAWLTTGVSASTRQKLADEARAEYINVRTRLEVLKEALRREANEKELFDALKTIVETLGNLDNRYPSSSLFERFRDAGTTDGNNYLRERGYADEEEDDVDEEA